MLHVGQLEVNLSQPDKKALAGSLKLLSLACKMLNEKERERGKMKLGEVYISIQGNINA